MFKTMDARISEDKICGGGKNGDLASNTEY